MGYLVIAKKDSFASIDWTGGVVIVAATCKRCKTRKEQNCTLREFLATLGITAEDCAKAFESEAADDN